MLGIWLGLSARKTFIKRKKDKILLCCAVAKPLLFMSLAVTWKADHVLNEHIPKKEGAGKQNM